MKGIKRHSHGYRAAVLAEMVPLIKKRFGDSLLAVAARGSFARGTDGPYSDLESFAFLKEMPSAQRRQSYMKMHKIRDGLSVELIWLTRQTYVNEVREVSPAWYGGGGDLLWPVLNRPFVNRLNRYRPADLRAKCLQQAAGLWPKVWFTGQAVIDTAERKDHEGIALALYHLMESLLAWLSFVNLTPYSSSSRKIRESRSFPVKPRDFAKLTKLVAQGGFRNYAEIRRHTESVRQDIRDYLIAAGFEVASELTEQKRPDAFGMKDRSKRLEQAVQTWAKVQEASTKTLNAAVLKHRLGMPTVINDMFFQYMKVLSCLNARTLRFSRIIGDAKRLKYLPAGFRKVIRIVENGEYRRFAEIRRAVTRSFTELEGRLESHGCRLYDENVDPALGSRVGCSR